jgi:ubiquinone/menaquinone biosynthesis C-methylase UbiE
MEGGAVPLPVMANAQRESLPRLRPRLYQRFRDGVPEYLARHYWWAYLWRTGVWFFDHQPVISTILFGQYRKLLDVTLERLDAAPCGETLQLSCVYGMFTPKLARKFAGLPLHITDVAQVQLDQTLGKIPADRHLVATRMNAESLGYADRVFDSVIVFFLLHELPAEARHRVLSEALRVLAPGGRLLMVEYAPLPRDHLLYRFPPFRALLTRLEPFLKSHWHEVYPERMAVLASQLGRAAHEVWRKDLFGAFYRVSEYRID